MNTILTIGYGNRDIEAFIALLKRHSVEVVCDVRTTPYSARYETFNREGLQQSLRGAGVKYIFLGDLLGARPSDPEMYVSGRVSYEAMERSSSYRMGIERLEIGIDSHRIAIMCAEKDPFDCHRAILVSRTLARDGVLVQHVGVDGDLESHEKVERRLLEKYGLVQASLFDPSSSAAALIDAYKRRGADLAYDVDAAYRARASS